MQKFNFYRDVRMRWRKTNHGIQIFFLKSKSNSRLSEMKIHSIKNPRNCGGFLFCEFSTT